MEDYYHMLKYIIQDMIYKATFNFFVNGSATMTLATMYFRVVPRGGGVIWYNKKSFI